LVSWENRATDGEITYPMRGRRLRRPALQRRRPLLSHHLAAGPGWFCCRRPARRHHRGEGPGHGGLSPTPAATASMATAWSVMSSCRCSQLGWERSGAVGWACRGPVDPERQPAAAGRQTAGVPPGLGASTRRCRLH